MSIYKYMLGFLLFGCVDAMNLSPVTDVMSCIKDKLSSEKVVAFMQEKSSNIQLLEKTKLLLNTGEASLYSSLAYNIDVNMFFPNVDGHIFQTKVDSYIAQFMLAGTIMKMFEFKKNEPILQVAFVSLAATVMRAESAIHDFFLLDIGVLRQGIRTIEELHPGIYE